MPEEINSDYPVGQMIEPYDIWRDKEDEEPKQFCGDCGERENEIHGQCVKCGCAVCVKCKDHCKNC